MFVSFLVLLGEQSNNKVGDIMKKIKDVDILQGFRRLGNFPLDSTSIQDTYTKALEYSKSQFAYPGQIIVVLNDDNPKTTEAGLQNTTVVYKINFNNELELVNNDTYRLQEIMKDEVSKVSENLDVEIERAKEAEEQIITDTSDSFEAVKDELEVLDTEIQDEIERAKEAETELQTNIDTEYYRAQREEQDIRANIATEISDREQAIADLKMYSDNQNKILVDDINDSLSGVSDAVDAVDERVANKLQYHPELKSNGYVIINTESDYANEKYIPERSTMLQEIANNVTLTNTTAIPKTLGAVEADSSVNGQTVLQVLDKILFPHVEPELIVNSYLINGNKYTDNKIYLDNNTEYSFTSANVYTRWHNGEFTLTVNDENVKTISANKTEHSISKTIALSKGINNINFGYVQNSYNNNNLANISIAINNAIIFKKVGSMISDYRYYSYDDSINCSYNYKNLNNEQLIIEIPIEFKSKYKIYDQNKLDVTNLFNKVTGTNYITLTLISPITVDEFSLSVNIE